MGSNGRWQRAYVMCVMHRSISDEQTLQPWGQVLHCTYNEANALCQMANRQQGRKRGHRLSVHKYIGTGAGAGNDGDKDEGGGTRGLGPAGDELAAERISSRDGIAPI